MDERDRLEVLTDWRKRTALERGVQSDVVLHKDTLFTVARVNPTSLEDLEGIDGFGPARRKLYGESIIAVLQALPDAASRV